MAFCVVCNTEIRDDARFCPACGAEQPRVSTAGTDGDPLMGKIVARKFQVEKLLGVGGMGKVYKARQLSLDKAVVVKVLHDHFKDDPQLVQRFQREAKAASRLNHPNSIQIIDFGQDESGVVFMAMEFLQGSDLFTTLKKDGAFEPDRVARIMVQVCSALAEAHEQNVIHRDLKPENIMIEDRRGQRDFVKVLDFGIAKIQDPTEGAQALTQAGMVCGTPEYMSPEQARGLTLDPRSDIYALGVVMYQLATGELPFTSDTPIGIVTKHILEKPQPPSQRNPKVPPALEAIILRAMEKEVDRRFSTVSELGEALEALLRTLPQPERQSGFSPRPSLSDSGKVAQTGSSSVPAAAESAVAVGGARSPTAVPAEVARGGTGVTPSAGTQSGLPAASGGGGVKIAAIAAVFTLLLASGVVFAFKDKIFGPSPAGADAGVVVAVADAGAAEPSAVDAGVKVTAVAVDVVDAGVVAAVVDAGTTGKEPKEPTEPKDPQDVKDPKDPKDPKHPNDQKDPKDPKDPKQADDAKKATMALWKAKKLFNERDDPFGKCSQETTDLLVRAAELDKNAYEPFWFIALCAKFDQNDKMKCAATDEYRRRGGTKLPQLKAAAGCN